MNEKSIKIYKILRAVLYGGAFLAAIFLTLSIVFPKSNFSFNFKNPRAAKNTLTRPQNESGVSLENGKLDNQEMMIFNAGDTGYFSQAKVQFDLDKATASLTQVQIEMKKSFQAFLYPLGKTIGWPSGSLLKSASNYYFVSGEELRKFESLSLARRMGFSEESFQEVVADDLKYNSLGKNITSLLGYPSGTVFQIGTDYYLLEGGNLNKFISQTAYQSYNLKNQAITTSEVIFQLYPLAEKQLGFASGSLLSYGTSAFIVNNDLILPIGDALIFEAKGFKWDDLIKIGGDELSFYEKGKIFELDSPHPERTVFLTEESNQYYLIFGAEKHLLPTKEIAIAWMKNTPVLVSENSLEKISQCQLKKRWGFRDKVYTCILDIADLNSLLGTDYQFSIKSKEAVDFSLVQVTLERNKNKANFKIFLADLIGKIKRHYVQ